MAYEHTHMALTSIMRGIVTLKRVSAFHLCGRSEHTHARTHTHTRAYQEHAQTRNREQAYAKRDTTQMLLNNQKLRDTLH